MKMNITNPNYFCGVKSFVAFTFGINLGTATHLGEPLFGGDIFEG